MTKQTGFLYNFIHPSKKVLFYAALVLYFLVGIFLCVLFLAKDEVRPVFAYTWTGMFVLYVCYLVYGYLRILITALIEKKKTDSLVKSFLKDKHFRSLYTRAAGVFTTFFFVGWNLYLALISADNMFHWILAEFYWFVSIIRLYMDYIIEKEDGKSKDVSYLIINICLALMSGVVVAITAFVLYFDAVFKKSWLTVFPIALFTLYKVISSILALIKASKTRSIYDWTFSQASFSTTLFSVYTLIIGMIILFTDSMDYKHFAYAGFGVAAIIFIFAILGIAFNSYKINKTNTEVSSNIEQ